MHNDVEMHVSYRESLCWEKFCASPVEHGILCALKTGRSRAEVFNAKLCKQQTLCEHCVMHSLSCDAYHITAKANDCNVECDDRVRTSHRLAGPVQLAKQHETVVAHSEQARILHEAAFSRLVLGWRREFCSLQC